MNGFLTGPSITMGIVGGLGVWLLMRFGVKSDTVDHLLEKVKADTLDLSKKIHGEGLDVFTPLLDAIHLNDTTKMTNEAGYLARIDKENPGGLLARLRPFVVTQIQRLLNDPEEQRFIIGLVAKAFGVDLSALMNLLSLFKRTPAPTPDQVAAAMKSANPIA